MRWGGKGREKGGSFWKASTEVSSLHFQGEKADSELVAFDRQVRGPFPSQSLGGELEPFPATLHYLDSIYGWIKLNIGQDSLKEKNLSVEPSTCHHCNKGVTHRSAGKSPGFISWPCHMTRGQGYQRLPPHMERISGHRAQQLLLLPPISFFILTHACVLLEMENHQPHQLQPYRWWIARLPAALENQPGQRRRLSTLLYPPHVSGGVPSPSWWRHARGSYPNITNAFPKKAIWCLPSQSLHNSLLTHLCDTCCVFGWVLQCQLSHECGTVKLVSGLLWES